MKNKVWIVEWDAIEHFWKDCEWGARQVRLDDYNDGYGDWLHALNLVFDTQSEAVKRLAELVERREKRQEGK